MLIFGNLNSMNNIQWALDMEEGVLTLWGKGPANLDVPPEEDIGMFSPWFNFSDKIKKIIIKEGITKLGDLLFVNCNKATKVIIPNSVKNIGYRTFAECKSLTEINLPPFLKKLGTLVFQDCVKIKEFLLPKTVEKIGEGAFEHCASIKEIRIPNKVKIISLDTFAACYHLKRVFLGKNVRIDSDPPFNGCDQLTKVIVDTENKNYTTINGVLFNKNKTKIVFCPAGKTGTYVIPDTVRKVGSFAFAYCTKLKVMVDHKTKVGFDSFYKCDFIVK